MKKIKFSILEPFTEEERKYLTKSEKAGKYSFITLISSALLSISFEQNNWIQIIFITLTVISLFVWLVSRIRTFFGIETRNINKIGEISFNENEIVINESSIILYKNIKQFEYEINDYLGELKYINENDFAKSNRKQGAHNYITINQYENLRIQIKTKKEKEYLTETLIPLIKTKANTVYN
jgi:hypothetical protein